MKTPAPFLSADDLRAATFVRHIEIHDKLDSTNNRAAELARDASIELPALVAARHQTAGRGRGTNPWWSAEGALTFSVLLDPAAHGIATANWPQLSLATAVAVCDALQAGSREQGAGSEDKNPAPCSPLPAPCSIKWPNDVLLGGRKIAGILIESPGGAAPAKDRLVVGIGMNVNNSWRSAPHDAGPSGTALCDVTGKQHVLQTILVGTLQAMNERTEQLATGDSLLASAWQRLCWLTEQRVEVHANNRWITGICVGIDAQGALLIENGDGVQRVCSGSVRVA
jgi:BirA family biotin operon repressor/biotin-[acetyl-CoA-carboxylase] ligase